MVRLYRLFLQQMIALNLYPGGRLIRAVGQGGATPVDAYWNRHTVNSKPFLCAKESLSYLEWRFDHYPLFREFTGLFGHHDGEVILDYGCGPGNDLVGFLVHGNAKKIFGVDVSERALILALRRLKLHAIDPARYELIRTTDATTTLPIETNTVDYVSCQGVLQHTSRPEDILKEFRRVLREHALGCLMVYSRDSLWFHLYTAYHQLILEKKYAGMSTAEAFPRTTDGEQCPTARCYRPEEFIRICESVGFTVEYVGGYFSDLELHMLRRLRRQAMQDERLNEEHREFLRHLVFDENGCPLYQGKHAGIGGVYKIRKT
jgi:ubiquinone/menaquinone biosynthesis C-methylase UbiE